MATYVAEMVREKLGMLNGARIAILGIAYKGGVDDTRESPGARLGDELVRLALESESTLDVWYHDPIVQADGTHDVEDIESALDGAQVCVLVTDHADYRDLDPERVRPLMGSKGLVDTRNLLDHEEWRSRGFSVDVV
jgi:UDP-N-acetyl-D-mannosaminuronic acid dehydrogenase